MGDGFDFEERPGEPPGPTYWLGVAEGGPLDGSEIRVEAAPGISLRGLHVNVCVGEEVESAEWHLYVLASGAQRFVHFGTLDGKPKLPPGRE